MPGVQLPSLRCSLILQQQQRLAATGPARHTLIGTTKEHTLSKLGFPSKTRPNTVIFPSSSNPCLPMASWAGLRWAAYSKVRIDMLNTRTPQKHTGFYLNLNQLSCSFYCAIFLERRSCSHFATILIAIVPSLRYVVLLPSAVHLEFRL
jgi:hypothetical protein